MKKRSATSDADRLASASVTPEDSGHDSEGRSVIEKDGTKMFRSKENSESDATQYGCKAWMSKNDVMNTLAERLLEAQSKNPLPTDALKLIECAWYRDTSTTSLQRMLSAVNEEVRIYDPELRAAKAEGPSAYAKLQKAARLIADTKFIVSAIQEATECGLAARRIPKVDPAGDRVRTNDEKHRRGETDRQRDPTPADGDPCNACGKVNHKWRDCKLKTHPHVNKTREAWATSEIGRRYAKAGKSELKWGEDENGGPVTMGPAQIPYKSKPDHKGGKGDKPKWQQKKDKAHSGPGIQVETLLDTGAVQGDYCSRAVGDYVRQHCLEDWQAADEEESIALAASGTSTMALVVQQTRDENIEAGNKHPRGAPFLGSVDVRRTKHVSEMLDFGIEEYGMIGDDTNLFPDASNPIDIADILAAIRMDGTESLKNALRALITEFADIFSNDVGITPALVEPMKLASIAKC
ncbi:hypothetical protein B484DRAFT_400203 [Ochromonadaceae sp. CCMP2298]|nr:hypothetical protein B484DRAFT_400203 [Ochromonadaceae sp. CCMP2298]